MASQFQINLTPLWWECLLALAFAAMAGALIGWEREKKNKPAGLKTHAMVSLGAAGVVLVGVATLNGLDAIEKVEADPMRLISGIATGVGFLGAGTIVQNKKDVHGLTTAATVWVSAVVGMACGLGFHGVVVGLSLMVLAILLVVAQLEKHANHLQDDA